MQIFFWELQDVPKSATFYPHVEARARLREAFACCQTQPVSSMPTCLKLGYVSLSVGDLGALVMLFQNIRMQKVGGLGKGGWAVRNSAGRSDHMIRQSKFQLHEFLSSHHQQ